MGLDSHLKMYNNVRTCREDVGSELVYEISELMFCTIVGILYNLTFLPGYLLGKGYKEEAD